MSVSFARTVRNFWRNGIKRSLRQIAMINDTKSGHFMGEDDFGNKYYETDNPEEIHMRTRWVEYKDFHRFDAAHMEPGWHYWLAYGTDTPPSKLTPETKAKTFQLTEVHPINYTFTKGAYVPYNTAKPKYSTWEPKVAHREKVTV
ncbi:hypothetical protein CANARDRAFT_28792 [[Candida] arabinofermentans NRRL YB-2248]|uniref:NADH dehydrogenase [ubiquinone] 1 alpha subcomplex subunit n=1 Tax=[Candida] arabinofermentans NRRL YB-2248 TaxID=983967 RepID=A0A1E4T010_9ASCO|nr:hypothetical protein CANARDRAFT_28792 [[Candida] arabinofermentans NRRL YB-2248]